MASNRLSVIALISGGKDSFYSVLHCLQNGHRVVALANLFPLAADGVSQSFEAVLPTDASVQQPVQDDAENTTSSGDLNSFMYQTVGHEVIPLYASATGLPLYRQPITGGSVRHERDYDCGPADAASDETESMIPLLEGVMRRHPEANALCAGAILSTYQRTRVESVALRLGLVPLAYLWKYPVLSFPGQADDDARLLTDMAGAGLEARIIKVASAGLDESHLWHRVTSVEGAGQVKRALRKFGAAGGAVLGEGGEFETVVLDGPSALFRRRIVVPEASRKIVREGGGSTWLMLRGAGLEEKPEDQGTVSVSTPELLEPKFQTVLDGLSNTSTFEAWSFEEPPAPQVSSSLLGTAPRLSGGSPQLLHWSFVGSQQLIKDDDRSIETETVEVMDQIRQRLAAHSLDANHISNTVVVIRRMSDFPRINAVYGKLFAKPNPPARVTISCGDLLPHRSNIAVYVSISPVQPELADRQGLHVQSRSYWAPANIGPYSQAVGVRITDQDQSRSLRTWSVAGQIPLIPSSMELPTEGPLSSQMQVPLSLQHLWRIARDLKIQFWTSAVAFFSAQHDPSGENMTMRARQAGLAWKLAHGSPDDEDETESGPDPWDLKYNPQFMSLGGESGANATPRLPDWEALTLRQQNEPEASIPPCFAVEVEELPRQSQVEWHAHVGLSQAEEGTIEVVSPGAVGASAPWTTWHTIAKTSGSAFLHTVVVRELPRPGDLLTYAAFEQEMTTVYKESLRGLRVDTSSGTGAVPYLTYLDAGSIQTPWDNASDSLRHALVPCHSVWSSRGRRLGSISLFRTVVSI